MLIWIPFVFSWIPFVFSSSTMRYWLGYTFNCMMRFLIQTFLWLRIQFSTKALRFIKFFVVDANLILKHWNDKSNKERIMLKQTVGFFSQYLSIVFLRARQNYHRIPNFSENETPHIYGVRTQILFYLLVAVLKPLIKGQNLLCTPDWYGLKAFYMRKGFFGINGNCHISSKKSVKGTSSRNFVSLCLTSLKVHKREIF